MKVVFNGVKMIEHASHHKYCTYTLTYQELVQVGSFAHISDNRAVISKVIKRGADDEYEQCRHFSVIT